MEKKEDWNKWIDEQINDMYNDESYTNESVNRVFKTQTDDRDVAILLLNKLKKLINGN
jgi:hypothetical protein